MVSSGILPAYDQAVNGLLRFSCGFFLCPRITHRCRQALVHEGLPVVGVDLDVQKRTPARDSE